MNVEDLDWNAEWNRRVQLRKPGREDPALWDRKAEGFARRVRDSDFAPRLLELLPLERGMRVLDVGCGEGSLTLPLARRVGHVTALDYSPAMLELLSKRIREEGEERVTPLLRSWYESWEDLYEEPRDLVLASRSFMVRDLAEGVEKLNRVSRKWVCVVTPAGETSWSGAVRRAVGRESIPAPDYIYALNYLYTLRIHAEVRFIETESVNRFGSFEEAFQWMKLALEEELPPREEELLRRHLEENLTARGEYRELPSRTIRWALLRWLSPFAAGSGAG